MVIYRAILYYGCKVEKVCKDQAEAEQYAKDLRENGLDIKAESTTVLHQESVNTNLH